MNKNSKKIIVIGLFLITVLCKLGNRILFVNLSFDNMMQLIASGNLLHHHGISDCTVVANDLSQVSCVPQTWWASGYSIFITCLTFFTNDFLVSDFILATVGIFCFFLAIYFIFKDIDDSSETSYSYLLFSFFSIFSFAPYHLQATTEILNLGFFALGCAVSLNIIKSKNYILYSILTGFLLFLTGFVKYSYYPYLTIIPSTLFLIFILKRERKFLYAIALYSLTVLSGFALIYLIIPNHIRNKYVNLSLNNEWNLENLKKFDPFPVKSIFYTDSILFNLKSHYQVWLGVRFGMLIVSFIIILGFLLYTLTKVKKYFSTKNLKVETYFYLLGSLTIIANIVFLCWLSIIQGNVALSDDPTFTYVVDTRLFMPSIFFILIFLFSFPFNSELNSNLLSKYAKYAGTLLISLAIIFAVIYSSWRYVGIFILKRPDGIYYNYDVDRIKVGNYLRDNISKENLPVVLAFFTYGEGYGANRINRNDGKANFENYDVSEKFATSKNVALYLMLPRELKPNEREFLESNKATKLLELSESDLYRIEVVPTSN